MFIENLRQFDYNAFFYLHNLGANGLIFSVSYFFAKYGIVFFFLSFIYLIIKKKIPAFLCALFAMGLGGTVDFLVFAIWSRPNPYLTYPGLVNLPFGSDLSSFGSFPSSHTYIAFAIATSLLLFGHKKLGAFLFILALLVAVSRIVSGYHYPFDVLGGIILGIFSGALIHSAFSRWAKYSEQLA